MKNYIKFFFSSSDKKRLLENFISLFILQGANYILPFITLPYLVRVLGAEKFGLIAFAQAFIQYFVILTDYGFNLSATREISINRENKEKISEIFSSVMIIKLILLFLSFIIMSAIVFSFDKFKKDWLVYYLTFGIVIGQALFPVWFFQGMERMKYITVLNVTSKLIFTISIFIFVRSNIDYIYVPLINSLGFILSGILGLWIAYKNFKVNFKIVSFTSIWSILKESWYVFLSQLKVYFFSHFNIIILGLLSNNTYVGYYSSAEKLMRAFAMLQVPITNTIFPFISKEIISNKTKAISILKRVILFGSLIYFIVLSLVYIYAEDIVVLLYGQEFLPSGIVLKIIAFVPLAIFLNNIFGTQILINIKRDKEFFSVLLIAVILNILLCTLLTYFYNYIGTSISLLIVEIWIMVGMYYYASKNTKELSFKLKLPKLDRG